MIADVLIGALILFIASITLPIHRARRHAPGRHAETPPDEWDDASLAALRGPARVHHGGQPAERPGQPGKNGGQRAGLAGRAFGAVPPVAARPLGAPPPPPATVVLPAYSSTVARAPVAGRPPWPAQPVIAQVAALQQPALAIVTARRDLPALKITACAVCGRQGHGTGGHDQWAALMLAAGMLRLPVAEPGPPGEFRLPAWDPPPAGLPAYARAALGAASVTGAIRQIFPEPVKSDA